MTTLEQIRVMQAYVDGKVIQMRPKHENVWQDCYKYDEFKDDYWDFVRFDYRIKPENKLTPYDCANEFLEAMKEHGPYLKDNDGILKLPLVIGKATVVVGFSEDQPTYEELAREYKWQDGSPCGIMQ